MPPSMTLCCTQGYPECEAQAPQPARAAGPLPTQHQPHHLQAGRAESQRHRTWHRPGEPGRHTEPDNG